MTLDALKLGQVVMSTQGRDAGRLFIVVGFAEENHVLICDGALRKIDKPKKKKVKHLNPKQECISSLGESWKAASRSSMRRSERRWLP